MENFDDPVFSFLDNDEFIQWVSNPNEASNAFWDRWLMEHPEQETDFLKAKQIALDLAAAQKPINRDVLASNIWENVQAQILAPKNTIPISKVYPRRKVYWAAASLVGLVLIGSVLYYFLMKGSREMDNRSDQKVAAVLIKDSLQQTNITEQNKIVYLVDGSKITLQPGASIKHIAFLQKDKREIYLDGDAFFEVAKDPNRPFYVYTNDIVLRVLGTSFNVRRDKTSGNMTVLVRTGKVSVYKRNNIAKPEFILTPNEGIRYTAQTQSIEKSNPDRDFLKSNSKPAAIPVNFNFEETPVANIFSILQDAYGIKIHFDEQVFSKCSINTSMGDEPFDEKLQIICEAVGANYQIDHNEVFVTGTPCK